MAEPWKKDKWFVSPWNFAPEVTSQLHFPKQVKFYDITLRDGEQQAGVIFVVLLMLAVSLKDIVKLWG